MSKKLILDLFKISIKNISKSFDDEIKRIDDMSQKIQSKNMKGEKSLANKLSDNDKVNELRFPLTAKIIEVQEKCEYELN